VSKIPLPLHRSSSTCVNQKYCKPHVRARLKLSHGESERSTKHNHQWCEHDDAPADWAVDTASIQG
jgi:hypothetical protein